MQYFFISNSVLLLYCIVVQCTGRSEKVYTSLYISQSDVIVGLMLHSVQLPLNSIQFIKFHNFPLRKFTLPLEVNHTTWKHNLGCCNIQCHTRMVEPRDMWHHLFQLGCSLFDSCTSPVLLIMLSFLFLHSMS